MNPIELQLGLTDLVLVIETLFFFCYFIMYKPRLAFTKLLGILFFFIFLSSFSGMFFHLFLGGIVKDTATYFFWSSVIIFLGATSSIIWIVNLFLIGLNNQTKRFFFSCFLMHILLFAVFLAKRGTIFNEAVLFFILPVTCLGLISVVQAFKKRKKQWYLLLFGIFFYAISPLATHLPSSLTRIDGSALYHLVQGIALFLSFSAFRLLVKQKNA